MIFETRNLPEIIEYDYGYTMLWLRDLPVLGFGDPCHHNKTSWCTDMETFLVKLHLAFNLIFIIGRINVSPNETQTATHYIHDNC